MLTPGDRVMHQEFGLGEVLSVKRRPGTKTGDTAWVLWDTHHVTKPVPGRSDRESSVYQSSLSVVHEQLQTTPAVPSLLEDDEFPAHYQEVTSSESHNSETDAVSMTATGGPIFELPEEMDIFPLVEGAVRTVTVNAYERDPKARQQCIATHGCTCAACNFNFAARYGPVAEGYIHVHHLRPLSEVGESHVVDPVKDLRPVCPNCHAVLHRRVPAYSIEEVKAFLR